ncbi:MAG: hypothetical protein WDA47_05740 [Bacilli bacterium]
MSENRRITKSDILSGISQSSWVYIPALDGELEIKPLTDHQLSKVESVKGKGINLSANPSSLDELKKLRAEGATADEIKAKADNMMSMDINVVDTLQAAFEADTLACKYGLVELWSDNDLEKLPVGAISQIAQEIYKLSGVEGGRDALTRFREQL